MKDWTIKVVKVIGILILILLIGVVIYTSVLSFRSMNINIADLSGIQFINKSGNIMLEIEDKDTVRITTDEDSVLYLITAIEGDTAVFEADSKEYYLKVVDNRIIYSTYLQDYMYMITSGGDTDES